ncbi:CoB--CoM heterodisulfide reductase iron-sulfur subunit B family protein [Candidatus Sumerlaeota bacterium]|nr:CoB--CoM heterodisulfide reductase iron-sulfur subunit B family protein [Candidatus Sumerlaeota bacterium]
MEISYYPGCTLKVDARNFEESAIDSFRELGVVLVELARWNCCGTVFSFTTDNVMYHLAPVRNLLRVREAGKEQVLTLCSMCFNTLKRAAELFNKDAEKRDKILNIMKDKEPLAYDGKTRVIHGIELIRDEIGFDVLKKKTGENLKGLRLAPYYGCMLLRPDGVGIDNPENPRAFQDLINAMGADAVSFPFQSECCGAYQTVEHPEAVVERARIIINSARKAGADALVVSCPLCAYNLDQGQMDVKSIDSSFETFPVLYFTECLYASLGLGFREEWKALHYAPLEGVLARIRRETTSKLIGAAPNKE